MTFEEWHQETYPGEPIDESRRQPWRGGMQEASRICFERAEKHCTRYREACGGEDYMARALCHEADECKAAIRSQI